MINILATLDFSLNIILWYGFTVLSTIYSKKYLDLAHDAHTLTLMTFVYAAVLKIVRMPSLHDLVQLVKNYDYFCLGLFNIGTILLTNIGMNETTVSLTYMVKVNSLAHLLSFPLRFMKKRKTPLNNIFKLKKQQQPKGIRTSVRTRHVLLHTRRESKSKSALDSFANMFGRDFDRVRRALAQHTRIYVRLRRQSLLGLSHRFLQIQTQRLILLVLLIVIVVHTVAIELHGRLITIAATIYCLGLQYIPQRGLRLSLPLLAILRSPNPSALFPLDSG